VGVACRGRPYTALPPSTTSCIESTHACASAPREKGTKPGAFVNSSGKSSSCQTVRISTSTPEGAWTHPRGGAADPVLLSQGIDSYEIMESKPSAMVSGLVSLPKVTTRT
jgi:hypothetical protein